MDTKLLLLSAVRFLCVKVASVVCNTRYGPCHGCDSFRFLPIHCWGTSPRPSHPDGKHEPLHGGHISSLIGPEPPEWKWLPIPGLKIIFHCSWGGGREENRLRQGSEIKTKRKERGLFSSAFVLSLGMFLYANRTPRRNSSYCIPKRPA